MKNKALNKKVNTEKFLDVLVQNLKNFRKDTWSETEATTVTPGA